MCRPGGPASPLAVPPATTVPTTSVGTTGLWELPASSETSPHVETSWLPGCLLLTDATVPKHPGKGQGLRPGVGKGGGQGPSRRDAHREEKLRRFSFWLFLFLPLSLQRGEGDFSDCRRLLQMSPINV